jgi:uncharacterized Zn-finger protein
MSGPHHDVKHQCELCQIILSSAKDLYDHVKIQHSRFQCAYCPKTFSIKSALNVHIDRLHLQVERKKQKSKIRVKVECHICGKLAVRLLAHIRTHNGHSKDYKCFFCQKHFANKTSLEHHVVDIHKTVPNKDHKCTLCQKAFSSQKDLKQHIRKVHCDRKYKCDLCDSAFKRSAELKRHAISCQNKHLGVQADKSHKCDLCDSAFTLKANLTRHVKDIHQLPSNLANKDSKLVIFCPLVT